VVRFEPPLPAPRGSRPKPNKPSPDFPLFPHAAGVWAKKIRGKLHYFGPWEDPQGALKKYEAEKEALHAGKKPRQESEGATIKDACNAFLNNKKALLDSGELTGRTWAEYVHITTVIAKRLGARRLVSDLRPDDFTALRAFYASRWGVHRLTNAVQYTRGVFRFAWESGLVESPVRYGPAFKGPSQKTMRLERARRGPRLFTAEEVRYLIDKAGPQLRAMILLGINCGFGNNDCGTLPQAAVNLNTGWIDYPRPKTGMPRRCPLWPETVQALREALACRPEPNDPADAGLVFITSRGLPWARVNVPNVVTKEMVRLMEALGIADQKGRGFYTLRHVFRTVADGAKDPVAADFLMGHEVQNTSSVYRERIEDERLLAVSTHVRAWLFGAAVQ
jgi:integrase